MDTMTGIGLMIAGAIALPMVMWAIILGHESKTKDGKDGKEEN
jgi:hypothetical protein